MTMVPFRRFLADRSAALAMIVIVAQLLVMQAVTATFACAQMDAAKAEGTLVLCHDDGSSVSAGGPEAPGTHDGCFDCPCAIGCGPAPSILATALGGEGLAISHGVEAARTLWPYALEASGPRAPPKGLALKRGPPSLFL
ncbi:hypothetical protein SAMN06297251_105223 [Fulvimarina manganoxydans]|uniref:DUF2946 domain-containing protein n=1 Tax=Fulvimarina manganoxydans TaxID=937218 RepID=A0A1W2B093_9HYPH|nr:hypothetical protein [Fulvimarina manganoxydans]SMC66220.1 hypothetical protein SAMN06297251_105223 [Fulvimarina manganoxydans]